MKPLYLLIAFVAGVALYASSVHAEVFAVANIEGVKISLHNEKCTLTEVSNLPFKATWEEKGKTYQGCWGLNGNLVAAFFKEDKTVAVIPAAAFTKVMGV